MMRVNFAYLIYQVVSQFFIFFFPHRIRFRRMMGDFGTAHLRVIVQSTTPYYSLRSIFVFPGSQTGTGQHSQTQKMCNLA